MKMNWAGVMPAVTTKFNKEDQLDIDMFSTNIKAQVDAGVHAIILGGTLGEASTLTQDEKRILVQHTVDLVEGKVPVVINIAEQTTKDAILAAEQAEKYGAKGIMILPPMRYKSTDYETVAYFKAVAQNTSLPMMIYNNVLVNLIFVKLTY